MQRDGFRTQMGGGIILMPTAGYEDIETIQELVRKLREAGALANSSCGIHVHIDASPFDARTLRNITNIMAAKEDLIYKALQVSVARQNRWCKPVEERFLEELNQKKPVSSGKLQFDGKDEAELISAIKFGPREKIEAAVQTIIDKMSDAKVHFRQCQAYMLSVSSSIVQMIQQYDLDMEQLLEEGSEREDTFAIIPRMQKREDFSQWLLSASLRMNQVMNQERDNTMKQVIQKAKQYIMDNYQDPATTPFPFLSRSPRFTSYFS